MSVFRKMILMWLGSRIAACLPVSGIIFLFLVSGSHQLFATHAAGAELTYKCLGGMVYQVDAVFFRDCAGTPEPSSVTLTYKSTSCSYSRTAIATKISGNNGLEITMPCATSPSSCNGGVTTGLKKWVYRAIITLPFACNDWVFSYRVCCRNCTVTTIQSPCASSSELYVESTLNNELAPCNNSPQFGGNPITFACLGQNFNYNLGVYDEDGDSLAYELITPKTSATTEVTWVAPASTQQPLNSSTPFTINQATGDINFTPSSLQIGIITVRVKEYRNGQLVGSVIRDMQVYTQICYNAIPSASGVNGTNNFSVNACAGQPLCFTINTLDGDSTQSVTTNWANLPGDATITQTQSNRPVLTFCWTPTQSDVSRTPKTFQLLVRDNACPMNGVQSYTYSVFVNGLQVTATSTDPTCSNQTNGSATVHSDFLTGYAIDWNSTPPQHSSTATGLGPGNYTVVVTDNNGCSASATAVINSSSHSISVDATATGMITCQSGNIGEVSVAVTVGQGPFTYLWNNGASSPSISGLPSGTYTVTVTDSFGCTATDTATVNSSPANISVNLVNVTHVLCHGMANGSVEAGAIGGAGVYSYLWNTGATTQVLENVPAGTYSVIISDQNGCSATASVHLNEPPVALSISSQSLTNVSCYGDSTGSAVIQVLGGTYPYQYEWSNGNTSSVINHLSAATYTLTVTDSAGCTTSQVITINQPVAPLFSGINFHQDVRCYGNHDGILEAQVTGGAAPYSFLWNTGESTGRITGLSPGVYTLTVTDHNGCVHIIRDSILAPAVGLSVNVSMINDIRCNHPFGSISVNAAGGTPAYSYQWNTGSHVAQIEQLSAGMYTVTVTDAESCTRQSQFEIRNLSGTINIINQQVTPVLCYGTPSGSIFVEATGCTGPCSYQWSNGVSTAALEHLASGTYTLTVSDSTGCSASVSATITGPMQPLIPVITVTQPAPCSGSLGSLSVTASGGTGSYSYLWSSGETTSEISGKTAGVYTVTVTDANGCNAILSRELIQPDAGITGSISVLNHVRCFGGSDGSAVLTINGGTGILEFLWSNGSQSSELHGVTAGNYSVSVTDASGCSYHDNVSIHQPQAPLTALSSVENADCLNGINGKLGIEVSGGSDPYSYLWNNGSTTAVISTSVPGTYTVTVTDAMGCTLRESLNLQGKSEFNIKLTGQPIICSGETITLNADSVPGGNYQWYYQNSPLSGAESSTFITPAGGAYSVSVTNECGTFYSDTIVVTVKSISNISISNNQIICPPETATLFATGGTKYQWTPATYITFTDVPDPIVSPQATTVYSVEISNEFGCKAVLNTTVAVICDSLFVPTGFSPNDDGVNDGYVIDGIENYPGNKLWVYNRYGKLVFKAKDYNNSWDGISNISGVYMNHKVPSGTYFYILDLNDRSKPRAGYLVIRH